MLGSVPPAFARWSTTLGCAGSLCCAPAGDIAAVGARIDGRGSTKVGALAFTDNAGTVQLAGERLPAVLYHTTNPSRRSSP